MSHSDFNHLLTSVDSLSPAQMRQLQQQLDKHLTQSRKPRAPRPSKAAQAPTDAPSLDDVHQKMMARGLIRRLPDPSLDIDDEDPNDQPVPIKGEPLSETILRERR
jgi:hypothetical protein